MSRSGAYRDLPITISCGQCTGCRLERSRQWAVRCVHEASMHEHNCFLTLTYDSKNLPPDGSLDVSHWQNFAKRLRHKYGPFRFFHCGEYGDKNGRPHYHAAIFGLSFFKGRILLKHQPNGDRLYTHPTLTKLWGLGSAVFGELTFNSAAYVARYLMKKVTGPNAEHHYSAISAEHEGLIISIKPEYITMSRFPGIGSTWINKYMSEVYPRDQVITNGKAAVPPKYYDQQYEKHDPEGFKNLKAQRRRKASKNLQDQTPQRLIDQETCTNARITQYKRTL